MKNDRFLKLIIIALLLINAATLAFLWIGKDHRPPHPEGRPGDLLAHDLRLSAQQMEIFDSLRDAHHRGVMEHRERIHELREQLYDKFPAQATPDATLLSAMASEQAAIDSLTYDHFVKMRAILNAEQKDKFDQKFRELLEQISGRQGPGRPTRPE